MLSVAQHIALDFQIVQDGTDIGSVPLDDPNLRNLVAEVSLKVQLQSNFVFVMVANSLYQTLDY